MLQAWKGLEALHNEGIMHRDLQPDNILVDGGGNVFINDFDVSCLSSDLAYRRQRVGNSAYASPKLGCVRQCHHCFPDVDT
jgi:phosphorylase kinase gamma subunit